MRGRWHRPLRVKGAVVVVDAVCLFLLFALPFFAEEEQEINRVK